MFSIEIERDEISISEYACVTDNVRINIAMTMKIKATREQVKKTKAKLNGRSFMSVTLDELIKIMHSISIDSNFLP